MSQNNEKDHLVNLYSTSLKHQSELLQANPMLAVQRLMETAEANKIKRQEISDARFNHLHTFRPKIKTN